MSASAPNTPVDTPASSVTVLPVPVSSSADGPAPGILVPPRPLFRPEELAVAYDYADRAQAPATLRAYAADWRAFVGWCEPRGLSPLPALPETVAVYIADEARRGRKPSTIGRRLAAIRAAHLAVQLEPPTTAPVIRRVVHGIRREHGTRAEKKAPATAERVVAMVAHCPTTLTGKRDRALMLLGFAGAFRRSELVALDVADLEEAADGLRVLVRRSKTDQEGCGAVVAIVYGRDACPVAAVKTWLRAAGITEGPVFRPVSKGGRALAGRLAPFSVARIVKHYAACAGLNPNTFAGHSLRSGFLTSAAERGKPLDRMMAVSRHRRVDTLLGYIRRSDDFRDHAGAGLL